MNSEEDIELNGDGDGDDQENEYDCSDKDDYRQRKEAKLRSSFFQKSKDFTLILTGDRKCFLLIELSQIFVSVEGIIPAVSSIMRFFCYDSSKFSGSYDGDFDCFPDTYDNISINCSLKSVAKCLTMVFMLRENESHVLLGMFKCLTFHQGSLPLSLCYNCNEERSRVLSRWKGLRHSDEMARTPDSSRMAVFNDSIESVFNDSIEGFSKHRKQLFSA